MNIIDTLEQEGLRTDLPEIRIGDTIDVNLKVVEGTRERIQTYQGVVIARKNGGIRETIVVRHIAPGGIGVERTFPLHSPKIDSIKVVRHGKVRRAKLYYLKNRTGKSAKLKEVQ